MTPKEKDTCAEPKLAFPVYIAPLGNGTLKKQLVCSGVNGSSPFNAHVWPEFGI
jgi:hypothetical protein